MYLHQENEGILFQSLTFYPDIQASSPLPYYGYEDYEYYTDIHLIADMKGDDFIEAKQIFGDNIRINDKDILGGIAIRAMITLQDYYVVNGSDTSFDNGVYAKIKPHSLKLLSNSKRWFLSKEMVYSYFQDFLLFPISKDPYINLRQSPNGKILKQIQKTDMPKPCECREGKCGEDKGFILNLGKDPTNPKWLKVAYIPPEVKDTSKAIYGVIHESQVSSQCEGF